MSHCDGEALLNVRGTLPNGASTFVLSPDGNLAYAYYPLEGRVRKFDVCPQGSATEEVGTGSVVAPPNTDMSEMTISPDGGTLFPRRHDQRRHRAHAVGASEQ